VKLSWSAARVIGLTSLTAAVLFAVGAAIALEIASRDRMLPGIVVLGVPVGGLTLQEAAARLGPASAAILDAPLQLELGERRWATTPRTLGVKLDPGELAAGAFGVGHAGSLSTNLREQLDALWSETVVSVTSAADGRALDDLMKRIADETDTQPRDARLELAEDGTLTYQTSQTGAALDQPGSRDLVARALAEGRPSVRLVTRTLPPAVDTEQVSAAHDVLVRVLADPAPIQLTFGQQHWTFDRAQLLQTLSLTQPDGPNSKASVDIHVEPLEALAQTMASQIDRDAQDARFSLDNGRLNPLRPSHDGQALNRQAATDRIKAAILAGQRAVELPVDVVHPAVTGEDASKLGIRELIGESTTAFAGAIPEKAHNIQLAAQRLNGVVVPPGGTFSFNKEVGPTTLEAGFEWGFGLTSGSQGGVHTVPSVAGGICQVATTLFQPVFWSGYQIEERYWHLYWIPAYTSRGLVGLDATVDADSGLDFKWINPTDQAVLIQASTDAEHITFKLFGQQPPWTVRVDDPIVSDRVVADPTPDVQEESALAWGRTILVESARDGFTVLLTRHVTPTGAGQPRDLSLKSIYAPAHTVTLVGTRGAPSSAAVSAAVEQLRGSQHAFAPLPAPTPSTERTYPTPNGPRTMPQIRDELRRAGWGGGSDQDALETYTRVAGEARR
jgi:vancomycin resistance protein YoaR